MPVANKMGNVNVGDRFGRLVAQEFAGFAVKSSAALWRCLCDCGQEKVVRAAHIRNGATRSCGCLQKERADSVRVTHGQSRGKLHRLWCNVKTRCFNPNGQDYARYGGRGITMRAAWADSFEAFAAEVGEPPNALSTLERIDNDRGYEPGNVVWASRKEQARNTSRNLMITYGGVTKPLPEWCDITGVSYSKVLAARYNGEDVTLALHRRVLERQGIPLRDSRHLAMPDIPQP